MPFYEVIYETGAHSLSCADTDEQMIEAVTEHHRRATSGEVGGPSGHPAERIVKVLKYDDHPASLNEAQLVSADDVMESVDHVVSDLAMGGQVSVPELASAVRNLTSPTVDSGPHESNYKATETSELEASWL